MPDRDVFYVADPISFIRAPVSVIVCQQWQAGRLPYS